MSANQDALLAVIADHHSQIAAFARKSYEADGRGAIRVEFPLPPPGSTVVGVVDMVYQTIDALGRVLSRADEDQAILLKMIETYDPSRQAVLVAAFVGGNPISMKLRLDPPTMVGGAEGVH